MGNLVIILAQRSHQPKLVGGDSALNMKDANPPITVLRVVNHLPDRRLQAVVAAISVQARVIGEALGVPAEIELIVGLIPIAERDDQFRLVVALEAGAGHDIEDPVRAVSVLRIVAAALNFEIIDVLGVNLRAQIGGDIGVGYGHAVNQPVRPDGLRACAACRGSHMPPARSR